MVGAWFRTLWSVSTVLLREGTADERGALLYGGAAAARLGNRPPEDYEGVVERFERIYLRTADELSEQKPGPMADGSCSRAPWTSFAEPAPPPPAPSASTGPSRR